jgi:hypothetical protein
MASNFYYFKITRKLLQNYFGSAFRELGTVFIVITIRTKFPDIIQIHSLHIGIIACLFVEDGGQHGVEPCPRLLRQCLARDWLTNPTLG